MVPPFVFVFYLFFVHVIFIYTFVNTYNESILLRANVRYIYKRERYKNCYRRSHLALKDTRLKILKFLLLLGKFYCLPLEQNARDSLVSETGTPQGSHICDLPYREYNYISRIVALKYKERINEHTRSS